MKKSTLYTGIGYCTIGIICILIASIYEFDFEGILWGLGGAGIGPGLIMIYKYFHYTNPNHRKEYENLLKTEHISMHDERNIVLRDRSGRITNQIMMIVLCIITFTLSFGMVLGFFEKSVQPFVILFSGLLIFQLICTFITFSQLNKKM